LLLVTCLVHGNEPAGERAAQEVLASLPADDLRCRLVVLRGNLAAAAAGVRCLDRDLNRLFPTTNPPETDPGHASVADNAERDELKGLILELAEEHADHPRYFLDFHTTSSETLPYLSLPSASETCREFAASLPIHRVSGFAQHVSGSIDRYLHEQDFLGFACEGGQHEGPHAVRSMAALLWLMLDEVGGFSAKPRSEMRRILDTAREVLQMETGSFSKYFTIIYRHALKGDEDFVMKPGFVNFQAVKKGELLAHDRTGPIHSPQDGQILMPLYQKSGKDGFFIVNEHTSIE
jgi:succinylglutamate desuccinylase